jgi:hypothetical protein
MVMPFYGSFGEDGWMLKFATDMISCANDMFEALSFSDVLWW